jgi:hypothetical protein
MKLLHIINDEKFVNNAISQFFKATDCESLFLIPVKQISDAKHLEKKYKEEKRIVFAPYGTKRYFEIIQDYNPDYLVVHGLSIEHKLILGHLKGKYKTVWNSWGLDLFSMSKLQNRLYKKKTSDLLRRIQRKNLVRRIMGTLVYWFFREEVRMNVDSEYYLKYINFISTVVKEDYLALVQAYPIAARINYIPFNYGGFLNDQLVQKSDAKNILLGNSANPDNNHIECFEILKQLNLGKRKVIVPLSYGGNQFYITRILEEGYKALGDNFLPIIEFLSKEKYIQLLNTVDVAIMNHSYQHAMGNILYLLSQGANVFMDFNNTAAQSLLRIGVKISNIDELCRRGFYPLSNLCAKQNFEILHMEYGENAISKRTQEFVDVLRNFQSDNHKE